MFELVIEYYNGVTSRFFRDTKEEIEEIVGKLWTDDADFTICYPDFPFYVFWEDRFDFGW